MQKVVELLCMTVIDTEVKLGMLAEMRHKFVRSYDRLIAAAEAVSP